MTAQQLTPAQTCLFKWGKEHAPDFGLAMTWIAIREFYAVKGTEADVAKWDEAVEKGWEEHLAGNNKGLNKIMGGLGAEPQAYLKGVGEVVNKIGMPGLDAGSCVVDWGTWACFCNWAAQQPPGQINTLPDKIPAGSAIPYKCNSKVSGDSSYSGDWPKPGQTNWMPWIIGGGVAAALLAGGGFYAYKKGYFKSGK